MAEEITLPIRKGFSLAAKAWGPQDGEPWLVLHGWLDNAAAFDLLCQALPPSWRLVCLDLAGHGHSDHRAHGSYTWADYAADTWLAAVALGWEGGFSLMGHSLGGNVALLLAGAMPHKVRRLVMIDMLGMGFTAEDQVHPLPRMEGLSGSLQKMVKYMPQTSKASIPVDDDLEAMFAAAQAAAKSLPTLLTGTQGFALYGLFKQATKGRCQEPEPTDTAKRARWESWRGHGAMPQAEAKAKYVALVESVSASSLSAVAALSASGADFASVDDAATKRAEKNFGGTLPVHLAELLVRRSLESVPSGVGVRWRSDRALLRPNPGPSYSLDAMKTFSHNVKCPTLAVTAYDGMYNGASFGMPILGDLFSLRTRVALRVLLELHRVVGWLVPLRKIEIMVRSLELGLRPSRKLGYFKFLTHAHLPRGGHHLHMTQPDLVAATIADWVRRGGGNWRLSETYCRATRYLSVALRWALVLGFSILWRMSRGRQVKART